MFSIEGLGHDDSCFVPVGICNLFPCMMNNCPCCDHNDAFSIQALVDDLEQYISAEGSFDIAMAYSMGTAAIFMI
jgi:hypothetical protein